MHEFNFFVLEIVERINDKIGYGTTSYHVEKRETKI